MVKRELVSEQIDKRTFALARHLVASYVASRAGLKELGLLRSDRDVAGDLAEWIASKHLGLKIAQSTVQKGYDAIDSENKTYQIKSRRVASLSDSTSFDFRASDLQFHYLVTVFFDLEFDVLAIYLIERDVVCELSRQTASTLRFRWNRKTAADSRVKLRYQRLGDSDFRRALGNAANSA